MVRPIAFAVLRLIANSNVVGCLIGCHRVNPAGEYAVLIASDEGSVLLHSLMVRRRPCAVSNHDCSARYCRPRACGHPSRRAQVRAPQDEVRDSFTASQDEGVDCFTASPDARLIATPGAGATLRSVSCPNSDMRLWGCRRAGHHERNSPVGYLKSPQAPNELGKNVDPTSPPKLEEAWLQPEARRLSGIEAG
jgi:hypothetical protein